MKKKTNMKKYIIGGMVLSTLLSANYATAENDKKSQYQERRYEQHEKREGNEKKYRGEMNERNSKKVKHKEEEKFGGTEYYESKEKEHGKNYNSKDEENHTVDFSTYEISELTNDEIVAIVHMREEEKMARDVYRTLSQTTDSKAFVNIPVSEGRHMDVFSQLIERYDLTDPIVDESTIGIYTDLTFTKLYTDLITKGQKSDKDAFEVGAMIEDLNMANLIKYEKETSKEDLKLAYSTLLSQSKHHMSAFIRNLEKLDVTYSPEHISETELDEAVRSGKEHMQKEATEGGRSAQEMEKEIKEKKNYEENVGKNFIQSITKAISRMFSIWFK